MIALMAAAALAMAADKVVHPDQNSGNAAKPQAQRPPRPKIEIGTPPTTVKDRTGRDVQNGLRSTDYEYVLGDGVTTKEVVYYSEGVACYAKVFYPKGFNAKTSKVPAVVMGQGYAGTHVSIEKYGNRLAEKGLVAMVIDYRGWGFSEGQVELVNPVIGGGVERDNTRFVNKTTMVRIKRTQVDPPAQQKDIRNAISFIQGEPGVDYQRIGLWGSSLAGGNMTAVAGQDARVKAVSVQVPAITGAPTIPGRQKLNAAQREDAIKRAREGQGKEYSTGFSRYFAVDQYVQDQSNADNWVGFWASKITVPYQAVAAENDQLIPTLAVKPAIERMTTPVKNLIIVPAISHFEMYSHQPFEISANAAADWFVKYLNAPEAADPPEAPAPAATGRGPGPAPVQGPPPVGGRRGAAPGSTGN